MDSISQNKTKIILLSGYLGAGKTTLIEYILQQQKQYKVAVIQNEYADEMGIESPLMQDSDGKPFDQFYQLPNGCICCSAKDDLLAAVEYLIENQKYQLDFILVEANGLADPTKMIQMFWVDDEMKFPAQLHSVYTIVAAHQVKEYGETNEIFQRQTIHADTIILNQIDQVNGSQLDEIEEIIQSLNPSCQIKQVRFCQVEMKDIFETENHGQRIEELQLINEDIYKLSQHIHADQSINFLTLTLEEQIDLSDMERRVGQLVWGRETGEVLRAKGLIRLKDSSFLHSFQCVEEVFEFKETNLQKSKYQDTKSKFLFITQQILQEEIIEKIKPTTIITK